MAGGFGTRLRPLTNNLPKPMVPVANRPVMEYIVNLLRESGIRDLYSLLFFHPEAIEGYFGDGSAFGVRMRYIGAIDDYGTAGSVGNTRGIMDSTFLVISGDILLDFDLSLPIRFHREKGAMATIVLTRVLNPLPYGIVITNKEGRILRFLEKPTWGEVFSDTINTGIYILEPSVFEYIPEGREFDFSKDLFPLLLREDKPLYGYVADGYWKDIGGLDEYLTGNLDAISGRVKLPIPGERVEGRDLWLGRDAGVDYTVRIEGAVLVGNNSTVGRGSHLSNVVIGDNCTIGENVTITDSVIWDDVFIGNEALLQENIVGKGTRIMDHACLGEGAVVSDHCHIGHGSVIKANVKVWPHKVVEDGATLSSSLIWGERWSKSIFGTYGVTGLANIELSPEFACKLGAAYGATLRKGSTVSTSRDSHKACRMINRAIMTGLLSTGVNVNDYGVIPMPVARYLARISDEEGGIHTRRSPFDPELIDLKFFDGKGLDLHPSREKAVERLFYREDFRRAHLEETGELRFPIHALESYRNGFLSLIDEALIREASFKVVIDYSFGSSATVFPSILGRLNVDVVAVNANLDGSRITKSPGEFEKALSQLSNIVRSVGAHMGIFLDAGGEKIYIVDEKGDVMDGDGALKLFCLLVFRTCERGRVAVPVTASSAIEEMAGLYGFEVIRTKVSGRSIMEVSSAEGVVFAGENTGGYIFPQFQPAFDGMFSIVKLLEMRAKVGLGIHDLVREIPPRFLAHEKVACPWEMKGEMMRRLIEEAEGSPHQLIEGVKIFFGKDWVVAYPSHDHPHFHIIAESSTRAKAHELAMYFVERLRSWRDREVG